MKVEVSDVLIRKIEAYVKRDPELYHSVERFIEWAIENDLRANLDIENEKLEKSVWDYQKKGQPIPVHLRQHIEAFVQAGKEQNFFLPDCNTVEGWINHTQKYNQEFKEARESMLLKNRA